jgi:hypothetical protein
MTHIFHGDWTRYTPGTLPAGAPASTMFAKRTSDGQDWYDYVHPGNNFGAGSAAFTVSWAPNQNSLIVGSAVRDPVVLFPAEQGVYEIPGYVGDPTQLNEKLYDPATEVFSDPVMPSAATGMQSLLDRVAALEAKQGGT